VARLPTLTDVDTAQEVGLVAAVLGATATSGGPSTGSGHRPAPVSPRYQVVRSRLVDEEGAHRLHAEAEPVAATGQQRGGGHQPQTA